MNTVLQGPRGINTTTYIYRELMLTVLILILGNSYCSALTLGVALDGSQPFSSIQSAVQASAHGDTVLVYPGRYIENVDYNGKNITIASLELVTGNPAYRDSTVIDGNRNGSVIKSIAEINQAGIYGVTITNGTGYPITNYHGFPSFFGGGILIRYAYAFYLTNCLIRNNYANWGGGIWVDRSTIHASDTIINDNKAEFGGGIVMNYYGQIIFDPVRRCSVYNNTSGLTQDITATDSRLETNIYLDLGTLCPNTDYYIRYAKSVPDWPGGFPVIDIQRGYRTEINHNLFVSPIGNDANDGLSSGSPLKSICRALQFVQSDSLNPKTVHLARGVYSTNDGQFFPISAKPYVYLIGDSLTYPVLENLAYRNAVNVSLASGCRIENLVLEYDGNTSGTEALGGVRFNDIIIRNIIINPSASLSSACVIFGTDNDNPTDYRLENVTIKGQISRYQCGLDNNMPDAVIRNLTINGCSNIGDELDNPWATFYFFGNKLTLENSKFTNNSMSYNDMAIVTIGMRHTDSSSRLIMNNVLVANNQSGGESPVYIAAFTDSTSLISNCTFANNRGSYFAATLKGNLQVSNCIFDNDTPAEILIENTQPSFTSTISFNNNLIRGYPQSFSSVSANQISFNDVVLTGEPGFCDLVADDPLSYRLGNSSMLRDAGTPDTTGLHLPAYDYYGNPRIYNEIIDIGCSEWNFPVANSDEYQAPPPSLQVYPNPFSSEAKINFSLEKDARVQLKIFNLRGQLLRTMNQQNLTKGEHSMAWNGRDDQDYLLSSGVYLLRLYLDGKAHSIRKVLKL